MTTNHTTRLRPSSRLTIIYEVGGTTNRADVTVETPTGTDQATVDVPMRSKAGSTGLRMTFMPGDFVYISAQNTGAVGSVTSKITDGDSRLIAESESSVDYGIATFDGNA